MTEKKENRGGARPGSGAKTIATELTKKPVTIGIPRHMIATLGGEPALKEWVIGEVTRRARKLSRK